MNNVLIYVVREKEEGQAWKVSPFISLKEAIDYSERFVSRTNKKRSSIIETIDGRRIASYNCRKGGPIEKYEF